MAAKKKRKSVKKSGRRGAKRGKKKGKKKRGNYVPLAVLQKRAKRLNNMVEYREKNPGKYA